MKVKIASTQSDFFRCVKIRNEVFVIEQKVDPAVEIDSIDETAIHCIATIDQVAVGCCRVFFKDEFAIIGRLAVLKDYRKHHVGQSLLQFVETLDEVIQKGKIQLHAQCQAQQFYLKNGYTIVSDIYQEDGIEHITMEKNL